MDRTILISAICGDIGSSAVRALRNACNRIVGCDMKAYSPVLSIMDAFYIVPAAVDTACYMAALKEIISKERINLFLPISEPELVILNSRRAEIESLGVKLLINNPVIIENFLDKLKTVEYLERIGLRTPKAALLREYCGGFEFPLIIKPLKGYGSKRLFKVADQSDLDYIRLKDDGSLIVQEYVGSDSEEYTTGVFSDGKTTSTITFRRKLGFGGLSAEAVLADNVFIDDTCKAIAQATGLVGCINVQSRRVDKNIFIPFEINPRISSTLLFRQKFGFDDAVWWMNTILGNGYYYRKKYNAGIAIRYVSECYFEMESMDSND
ncbi:MAG: hypothetical protein C0392_03555 [Syntrophus sp. (in: bacteria)]|nr:hypothetical protein [Syntrophus sp. (in: bacteria)]